MRLGLAWCLKRSRDFAKQQTWELGIRSWWFHNEGFGQFLLKNLWPENAICHLAALFFLACKYIRSLSGNELLSKQFHVHDFGTNGLLLSCSWMRLGLAGCLKRSRDIETNQTGALGFKARSFHNEGLGQFLLKKSLASRVLSAIWPHFFPWLAITSTAWVKLNYCQNNSMFMIWNEIRPQKWVASVTQLNNTWSC